MTEVEIQGFRELQEDLLRAVRRYPDMAQKALEQEGKQFKKDVIKETSSAVFKKTGNLAKGYKVDPVEGFGAGMHVNFRATAPHFHLIENGHEKVTQKTRRGKKLESGGRNIGFTPGRLIVAAVRARYTVKMPLDIKERFETMLRECGLI